MHHNACTNEACLQGASSVILQVCNGLPVVSLTLDYQGRNVTVDNIILDTGAAESLIDWEAVKELQIESDDDDIIVPMAGIGGRDYALRKRIDGLQFSSYCVQSPYLDFGNMDEHPGVNGLLGFDILSDGRFVIDLESMEVYQKGNR